MLLKEVSEEDGKIIGVSTEGLEINLKNPAELVDKHLFGSMIRRR